MTNDEGQKLRLIAEKIISRTKLDKNQKFGSVIAILMIISIILTAIRVLQECNKSKTKLMSGKEKCVLYGSEIKEFSRKRGWFTRMRLKKIIRKELNKEDYVKYSIPLIEAILDTGESLTEDEIVTLVEASHV
jgi:hypothetical protein